MTSALFTRKENDLNATVDNLVKDLTFNDVEAEVYDLMSYEGRELVHLKYSGTVRQMKKRIHELMSIETDEELDVGYIPKVTDWYGRHAAFHRDEDGFVAFRDIVSKTLSREFES